MKSVNEFYQELIVSGVWNGPTENLKRNCSKCYGKRHVGKYTRSFDIVTDKDGNQFKSPLRDHYSPCACIKSKINNMIEEEKKKAIVAIGDSNLKDLEDESSS